MDIRGERVEIATPDGTAEAYISCPDDDGPHPGVVLYMDAFGLRPQIEAIADRIAGWGFAVLAPNVFYRSGSVADLAPTADLRLPGEREAFFGVAAPRIGAHTADRAAIDAAAYTAALRSNPDVVDGPIGVVGFCMGGRLALRHAAQYPDDVAALAMFHVGGLVTDAPDSPHLCIPQLRSAVLAGYADGDRSMPPAAIETVDRLLSENRIAHRTAVYPGAAHGFTMADTSSYQEQAAERAFDELAVLFADELIG